MDTETFETFMPAHENTESSTQASAHMLLQERARRLAATREQLHDVEDGLNLLVCLVREERYGVEIGALEAVHAAEGLVPVPCTPAFVAGILNVRGEVITVLDLAALLGLGNGSSATTEAPGADQADGTQSDSQVLLLETRRQLAGDRTSAVRVGLLVDAVVGIEYVPSSAMTPALSGHDHARGIASQTSSSAETPVERSAVVAAADTATVVLDVDRLFAGERFVVMEEPS